MRPTCKTDRYQWIVKLALFLVSLTLWSAMVLMTVVAQDQKRHDAIHVGKQTMMNTIDNKERKRGGMSLATHPHRP